MNFPFVPFSTIFGGAVVSGLVNFFASKAGMILSGLGLTFFGVKGFESLIGVIVGDLQSIVAGASGMGGGLTGLGSLAVQVAAYTGLFDAVNIVLAGFMAYASLMAVKFIVGRIVK